MGKTLPPPPPPDLKTVLEEASVMSPLNAKAQAFMQALLQLCRDHEISLDYEECDTYLTLVPWSESFEAWVARSRDTRR
jgi:hypothetical protein